MSTYLKRGKIGYLIMTGLCLVFAVIYEFLGHDVFSWRIRLLFLLPLSMFLLFLFMKPERSEHYLPAITCLRLLVASGIARNAFIGITEVYGTTSSKITNMTVISAALAFATVVATIVCVITRIIKEKKSSNKSSGDEEDPAQKL